MSLDELQTAAALAEQVYRRNSKDQPVGRISDSVIRRSLCSCGCTVAGYAFG